jgi:hypothetical protein
MSPGAYPKSAVISQYNLIIESQKYLPSVVATA